MALRLSTYQPVPLRIDKQTVISWHNKGFISDTQAARLVLLAYCLLSQKNGVPCTVSCKHIADELNAPINAVYQSLCGWKDVKRLGHTGQRKREWEITEEGVKKYGINVPHSPRNTSQKTDRKQARLQKESKNPPRQNEHATGKCIRRNRSNHDEAVSLSNILQGSEGNADSLPPSVEPTQAEIEKQIKGLIECNRDRKRCIFVATGKPYPEKNKIFDQALELKFSVFVQDCAYAAAWRLANPQRIDQAMGVLCNRFKTSLGMPVDRAYSKRDSRTY